MDYQAAMQLIFVVNMDADEVLHSLANVNVTTDLQHRPIGGTMYVYQWSDNSKKDDWRAECRRLPLATGRFREVNEVFHNRLEEVL